MRAYARLATELRDGPRGRHTEITTLRSDPPLALRPAIAKGPEPSLPDREALARVLLTAAAAGPVGGDHYRLDVHVGARSTLLLTEVSATLLLPSHDGAQSRTDIHIQVDPGGTFVWLPEPLIAARRCDHVTTIQVDLAASAGLLMREEILLGRHDERPGRLEQHVRVRRDRQALYSQDLHLGTRESATPAVTGDYRAVGSALVVDPAWNDHPPQACELPGAAAVMPLAGGAAALVTALADDNLALRRQLTAGLEALGPPWQLGTRAMSTADHR